LGEKSLAGAAGRSAVPPHFARVGVNQPGNNADGGGFAGAVGAEVAGDFAGLGDETDLVHGRETSVTLCQVTDFKHVAVS
jgi:hypothetical protein